MASQCGAAERPNEIEPFVSGCCIGAVTFRPGSIHFQPLAGNLGIVYGHDFDLGLGVAQDRGKTDSSVQGGIQDQEIDLEFELVQQLNGIRHALRGKSFVTGFVQELTEPESEAQIAVDQQNVSHGRTRGNNTPG